MGRKWTMRIIALGGHWSYLAVVDDESGVWKVDPETYVRQDNGIAIAELEDILGLSSDYDGILAGGFDWPSRHAAYVMDWRPGSVVLDIDPPYDYDPNVVY